MLWVNLIMDTFGALALGTEKPTPALLQRRPYKRTASLVSRPMWRNIACQSVYQLALLFALLFYGAEWFGVHDMSTKPCFKYKLTADTTTDFGLGTTCPSLWSMCKAGTVSSGVEKNYPNTDCLRKDHFILPNVAINLSKIEKFEKTCLTCEEQDFEHGTIIFNSFIWCQIFNEYTARSILDEWNAFAGISTNIMFLYVSIFSVLSQVIIVEYGGTFTSTSPLTLRDFMYTTALGAFSMVIGVLMRFIPVPEDPFTFFAVDDAEHDLPSAGSALVAKPV